MGFTDASDRGVTDGEFNFGFTKFGCPGLCTPFFKMLAMWAPQGRHILILSDPIFPHILNNVCDNTVAMPYHTL